MGCHVALHFARAALARLVAALDTHLQTLSGNCQAEIIDYKAADGSMLQLRMQHIPGWGLPELQCGLGLSMIARSMLE